MPKRIKPQWGNIGAIPVHGFEQTDDDFVGPLRNGEDRTARGCMFSDSQFLRLAEHLNITDLMRLAEARFRLDWIREFYLTSRLYQKATPAQSECNAALSILNTLIEIFLAAVAALKPQPFWSLAEQSPIEGPSPYRMFMTFPQRLRALASIARTTIKNISDQSTNQPALLLSVYNAATNLADTLMGLDHASQGKVMDHLPRVADYDMDSFSEVTAMARRLGQAASAALAAGRKRGGPRPFRELLQTVAWLAKVFERYGGRVTHTPREKTKYDGTPHSAAGRFMVEFFKICDPTLRDHTISSVLAEVIEARNKLDRQERGRVFLIACVQKSCEAFHRLSGPEGVMQGNSRWRDHSSRAQMAMLFRAT